MLPFHLFQSCGPRQDSGLNANYVLLIIVLVHYILTLILRKDKHNFGFVATPSLYDRLYIEVRTQPFISLYSFFYWIDFHFHLDEL